MKTLICIIATILQFSATRNYEMQNFDSYTERLELEQVEFNDKRAEDFLTNLLHNDSWYGSKEKYFLLDVWLFPHSSLNSGRYEFFLYDFGLDKHLMPQFEIQYYVQLEGKYFFIRKGFVNEIFHKTSIEKKFAFYISPVPSVNDRPILYIKYSILDEKYYIYKKYR